MYKIKKRALTLLILTTLLLTLIPIMPASAVTILDVTDPEDGDYTPVTDGDKGDTVAVRGDEGDVPAGYVVELYWDDVTQDWDGVEGKMNETTADSDGSWEVWFDVPEAEAGSHYLWVKTPEDGETDSFEFEVLPKVKVSPSSGLVDERTTVELNGMDGGKDVVYIWAATDAAPWDTVVVAGEALDTGDGAEEDWDDTVANDPIMPGTFDVYIEQLGVPALAFTDDGTGDLDPVGTFDGDGKINYVTGEWELENVEDGGLPIAAGEAITADYEYFDETATQEILTTGVTNSLGTIASKRITVPAMPEAEYYVVCLDAKGNVGTDDYTIGAVIEVDIDEVETGDVIQVRGKGFTPDGDIVSVELLKDGVYETDFVIVDDEDEIDGDGEFNIEVVMPEGSKKDDDFEIEITDTGALSAAADLEIIGLADIDVDPEFGPQGSRISYEASGLPKIKGEDVILELHDDGGWVADIDDDLETSSDGTISGTFRVPTELDGMYDIVAQCVDHDIAPDTEFRIGTILVLLSDDEGPTGMEIVMTGSGFTEDGEWNATFGDEELFEDEVADGDGLLGANEFFVPQVAVGTYEIVVWDVDAEITVTVEFTVTGSTMATITPTEAPRKYNMSLEGMYWPDDDRDLEFTVYNDTDDWDITGMVGSGYDAGDPITPDRAATSSNAEIVIDDDDAEDGQWIAWWKIDNADGEGIELDEGDYMLNITDDDEDYIITLEFTIGAVHSEISPRKAVFRIEETVSFNVEHSYGDDEDEDIYGGVINVYDPMGNLYWAGDPLDTWTDVDLWWVVPLSDQTANGNPMVLLDDAPLGEWSYEWLDDDDDELATGTFNVESSEADVLSGQIEDLSGELSDLSDDVAGVSDEIAGVKSDINDAIAAANAATQAANAATEAVNSIAETANSAAEAAENAAQAAEDAKAASSGLTTLVYGAIGASLVAALAAIVSLMQISRRIAG
jgi:hypothetical protein